ncbi:hypothetical protein ACT7DH_16120 [Bacillus pacificus]
MLNRVTSASFPNTVSVLVF